ncbi:hypothetical protein [Pedobacter sp. UYP1]|uniref:hypothetical protein n=1 Tax=Pedobacter sp. UYP1 TaxID=1756396 RepID=UPI0033994B36
MKFFKRTKRAVQQNLLSEQISNKVLGKQRQWADFLNSKTSMLSSKTLLFALIIFIAAFGSYCLYLIVSAFH